MKQITSKELMQNDTYKLLLQKSQQNYFTKEKVKMPTIAKIQDLLESIGIEVHEKFEKDTLKVGKIPNYNYKADGTPIIIGYAYEVKFSTRDGYYSRNTSYHAKEVIDFIDNWMAQNSKV